MEQLGLIITVVGSVIGATWALRGALGGIETALRAHIAKNDEEHKALDTRVVKLEKRRSR